MKVANKEMSVRKPGPQRTNCSTQSARKAVSIQETPRREALRTALSEMRDPELYGFLLSNVDVEPRSQDRSRIFPSTTSTSCFAIAAGNGPSFVRRNALHPHRRAMRSHALDVRARSALVARLSERALIAFRSRAHGHERLRLAFPLRRHLGRRAVRGSVLLHEHP